MTAEPITFELGRFYSVPTVRGKISNIELDWPVLGPKHGDREIIGFPFDHYHIDWRFVSKKDVARVTSRLTPPYGIVLHEGTRNKLLPAVVMRRRICHRTFESMGSYPHHVTPWLMKLEAAYAGCKMKNMTCPHRGLPLQGCEQEDDIVTCPGHGLRWNVNTGELAPYRGIGAS